MSSLTPEVVIELRHSDPFRLVGIIVLIVEREIADL
jgi:hypothetical protein